MCLLLVPLCWLPSSLLASGPLLSLPPLSLLSLSDALSLPLPSSLVLPGALSLPPSCASMCVPVYPSLCVVLLYPSLPCRSLLSGIRVCLCLLLSPSLVCVLVTLPPCVGPLFPLCSCVFVYTCVCVSPSMRVLVSLCSVYTVFSCVRMLLGRLGVLFICSCYCLSACFWFDMRLDGLTCEKAFPSLGFSCSDRQR